MGGDSRGRSGGPPPPLPDKDLKNTLKRRRSPSPEPLKRRRSPSPDLVKKRRSPSPEPTIKEGSADSLSIEETNKLRASIGLPPLKINQPKVEPKKEPIETDSKHEGTAIPNSDVRHKPAENLTNKSATEKMRERLQQRKMKRMQESKLLNIATLGAADDVDDTAKW